MSSNKVNLLTFMYFIHIVGGNKNTSTVDFYNEWSYVMDDFYELEGDEVEGNV